MKINAKNIPLKTFFNEDIIDKLLKLIFFTELIISFFVLLYGIKQPILDLYSFRQTQTALTSFWLLRGGPWLAYETPVLGAPWSIPFEFPVYQLIVSALSYFGLPLVIAGRLVSWVFAMLCLWPLFGIISEIRLGRRTALVSAILYISSPIYLYWSRTFMIESCALFFSMLWLYILVYFINRKSGFLPPAAFCSGAIAVLAKSTTFPAFAAVGAVVCLLNISRLWSAREDMRALVRFTIWSAFMGIGPLLVGLVWVHFTDIIKDANMLGSHLTSRELSTWNFGTMKQRTSSKLWLDVIGSRTVSETIGYLYFIPMLFIGYIFEEKRNTIVVILSAIGFFTPFIIFTNLHVIHSYYQVANAIFLLFSCGIIFSIILERLPFICIIFLSAFIIGQYTYFYNNYWPYLTKDYSDAREIKISEIVNKITKADESILVFGQDWSSATTFYSQRKSLSVPGWIATAELKKVLEDPQKFLDGFSLGAVVSCNLSRYSDEDVNLIKAFLKDREILGSFKNCGVYSSVKS